MNKPLHPDQLRDLIPLNALSPRQLWELRARTVPLVLTAGEVLELDERHATTRYYLMAGKLLVSDVEGQQGLLAAGTPAALHSLLSERTREVRALEDCHLLSVDAVELDRLLSWRQALQDVLLQLTMDGEETEWLERLLENPLFAQVPPQNIRSMLHRLVSVEAPAGQTLLREGEAGTAAISSRVVARRYSRPRAVANSSWRNSKPAPVSARKRCWKIVRATPAWQ